MLPDHDPTDQPAPDIHAVPDGRPVFPVFQEQPPEPSHQDRLEQFLTRADDLADACSDLIRDMRAYTAVSPVTNQLVEAHGLLVTAANTLASTR